MNRRKEKRKRCYRHSITKVGNTLASTTISNILNKQVKNNAIQSRPAEKMNRQKEKRKRTDERVNPCNSKTLNKPDITNIVLKYKTSQINLGPYITKSSPNENTGYKPLNIQYDNHPTQLYISRHHTQTRKSILKNIVPTGKAVAQSKLKPLSSNPNLRGKNKNGTSAKKTAKPTVKAVRPSLRTHGNLEAATRYKNRKRKLDIKARCKGYKLVQLESSIECNAQDNLPNWQYPRTRQNTNKTKLKIKQVKTVRPSSRGNQIGEAARCYKTRKNAVQSSSRGNQNLEAARCNKSRKNDNKEVKDPTNLTAVKTNLTAVKTNLTSVKTTFTTKYKFNKAIVTLPRLRHVAWRTRRQTIHNNSDSLNLAPLHCNEIRQGRLPHLNKHTPYGPCNLPHMVLCTKQGPDNA